MKNMSVIKTYRVFGESPIFEVRILIWNKYVSFYCMINIFMLPDSPVAKLNAYET